MAAIQAYIINSSPESLNFSKHERKSTSVIHLYAALVLCGQRARSAHNGFLYAAFFLRSTFILSLFLPAVQTIVVVVVVTSVNRRITSFHICTTYRLLPIAMPCTICVVLFLKSDLTPFPAQRLVAKWVCWQAMVGEEKLRQLQLRSLPVANTAGMSKSDVSPYLGEAEKIPPCPLCSTSSGTVSPLRTKTV